MEKGSNKALLAIIAVNFIWGLDFIIIEYMMEFVSPTVFTLTRLIIGTVILMAIVMVKYKGLHIKKEDWPRVFISGGVGMALYFTVENLGTGMTSASFSSLIMATVPVFGMIGDRIFFGRKITFVKVACVIASIIGVYLLVSGEPMGIDLTGTGIMLIAALLWTFYITYVKPLYDKYDLLTLLTGLFVSGLIVEIPLAIFAPDPMMNFTPTGIVITVASAIVCIIIGEFGYVYAIGKLSITMVSIFENVLPLTAVLFSLILFGTMLSGVQLVGGIIIMGAVTVLALKDN
jgi:drug/metabolite transporter (DMT)-like permease